MFALSHRIPGFFNPFFFFPSSSSTVQFFLNGRIFSPWIFLLIFLPRPTYHFSVLSHFPRTANSRTESLSRQDFCKSVPFNTLIIRGWEAWILSSYTCILRTTFIAPYHEIFQSFPPPYFFLFCSRKEMRAISEITEPRKKLNILRCQNMKRGRFTFSGGREIHERAGLAQP